MMLLLGVRLVGTVGVVLLLALRWGVSSFGWWFVVVLLLLG